MNAIDLIKQDHRKVEQLFAEFMNLEEADSDNREDLFQQIEMELLAHAEAEEKVFYPAIEPEAEDKVEEALSEHQEVKELLAELMELDLDDEGFDEKMTALMENVQHHVEEEEAADGVLERARKALDAKTLSTMGTDMQKVKQDFQAGLAA
jgi:hypothetical protein